MNKYFEILDNYDYEYSQEMYEQILLYPEKRKTKLIDLEFEEHKKEEKLLRGKWDEAFGL